MHKYATLTTVAVQVETARRDVFVPDGIALPQRSYPTEGIDLVNAMVYPTDTDRGAVGVPLTGYSFYPRPRRDVESINRIDVTTTTVKVGTPEREVLKTVTVASKKTDRYGPCWAHTRFPISVNPGDRVNWSGMIAARRPGTLPVKDRLETEGGVNVQVKLWGLGTYTDEYGVDTDLRVNLISYEFPLASLSGFPDDKSQVVATLPTVSDATVPAGIDSVHMSIALRHSGSGEYLAVAYDPDGDRKYFSISTVNPPRIFVKPPATMVQTVPHVLSKTGAAFRNRFFFNRANEGFAITLLAAPDASTVQTVSVWQYSGGVRGALIRTIPINPGQRVTTELQSSTALIELTSSSAFYVESVVTTRWHSRTQERTQTTLFTYRDITGDVNQIDTECIEADLGVHTIRFVSDTVDAAVLAGRRVRILGLQSGGAYAVIATGTIRSRRIVHDHSHPDQVEIGVHDDWGKLGAQGFPVAYDRFVEYGPVLNRLGISVISEGVDYSGPAGEMPAGFGRLPSFYKDSMTLADALLMTRNTRRAYMRMTRDGDLEILQYIGSDIKITVSDRPGQGSMSYCELETLSDTADLVNVVRVDENMLDRRDFIERELPSGDPPFAKLGYIAAKSQSIEYRRQSSIDVYGLSRRSFSVVRGTGSWNDIQNDNYGRPFDQWATEILDANSVETLGVKSVKLVIESESQMKAVSTVKVLDAVRILYKGTSYVRRVRRIEHSITPGRWSVVFRFDITNTQTYWPTAVLPAPEPPFLMPASVGRDGGDITSVSSGSLDGGSL